MIGTKDEIKINVLTEPLENMYSSRVIKISAWILS